VVVIGGSVSLSILGMHRLEWSVELVALSAMDFDVHNHRKLHKLEQNQQFESSRYTARFLNSVLLSIISEEVMLVM